MRRAATPPSIVIDEDSEGSAATREELQPHSPTSITNVHHVLAAPQAKLATDNVVAQIPGSPPQLCFTRVTVSHH